MILSQGKSGNQIKSKAVKNMYICRKQKFCYVLVYDLDQGSSGKVMTNPHCVYVDSVIQNSNGIKEILCLNSHEDEEKPRFDICDYFRVFQVNCEAIKKS